MVKYSSDRLYWYWESDAVFFSELEQKIGALSVAEKRFLVVKIETFIAGKAKRRVDFKPMVAFSDPPLYELRWELERQGRKLKVRLLFTVLDNAVFILLWHVKQGVTVEEQRLEQNLACEQATARYQEMRIRND